MNAYHLEMARKIVEKDHVEFGEDFVALTVMCYLKDNTKKFLITPAKQSQMLHTVIMIMSCQIIMIACIQSQFLGPDAIFHFGFVANFYVLLVKFPCSIALHLYLHPEVSKGLVIMKYANN